MFCEDQVFFFHFSIILSLFLMNYFIYYTVFKSIYRTLYSMDMSPLSEIWTTDIFPTLWFAFHDLNIL